jgi:hypothetical protein
MQTVLQRETAEAAGRILTELRRGDAARLASELHRAAHLCKRACRESDDEERTELLAAVVDAIREGSARGVAPCSIETWTGLLQHLAEAT